MPALGPFELLIILTIIIAIFGASRLAGVGAALGKSVSDFRKGVKVDDAPAVGPPAVRDDTHVQ